MFVGARHDEAGEVATLQLGAQRRQAQCRRRRGVEPVIGRGELGPPRRQGLGQLRIGPGIDQFDPFGAGQALGSGGHPAHQGIEGRRVRVAAALPEEF
jgi:hypothetical protein